MVNIRPRKRLILRQGRPYLTRWSILDRRIYLHRFDAPDTGPSFHTHPSNWSISILLKGSYTEERIENGRVRSYLRKYLNLFGPSLIHRIAALHNGPVWTLFISGPTVKPWYHITRPDALTGTITDFQPATGRACISYNTPTNAPTTFSRTCFDSGAPFRFPQPGDKVTIILSETNKILKVRLIHE